ncbi:AmmeMemoRadiSam system radical SAM enzyme [archaeon]|nr:AmmeMemoRadiSam system radical SAM enzyme [archaeon]
MQKNRVEARLYEKLSGNQVRCNLCPRRCIIPDGGRGFCEVRENQGGTLYTLVYGQVSSMAVDPIEKKPLFHFWPGSATFSIATLSCNLRCIFCQNWQLAHSGPDSAFTSYAEPREIVSLAQRYRCESISYTYNEPVIWFEYILDVAKLAKQSGLLNVLVTNAYITEDGVSELAPYVDAAAADLKAFTDRFYQKLCHGAHLQPVLDALVAMKERDIHVEIINLIIPGWNDSPDETRKLCRWVRDNLGPDTPLHFSRFFPHYQMVNTPPTPLKTLMRARTIAQEEGLHYVFVGNAPGLAEDTLCPNCGQPVIRRYGFDVVEVNLTEDNACKFCQHPIPIRGRARSSSFSHRFYPFI